MSSAEEQGEAILRTYERDAKAATEGAKIMIRPNEMAYRLFVAQSTGQIQMAQALAKYIEGVSLTQLKEFHDKKDYQAVPNPATGKPMTWAEWLDSVGLKPRAIEEKFRIMNTLGEEFLQLASAMGMKRNQVRLLLAAPSEVQAKAAGLARAHAEGNIGEEQWEEDFGDLVTRIEQLERTSAGRERLVEERDKAVETADLATGEAERAKKDFKVLMGNLRAHQDDNARLRRELDTPPRLRDQRLARQYLHDVELRAESVACRIEEAGEVVEHLFEEEQGALAEDLADAVLHATEQIFDRYVAAYSRFLRLPLWQPKHAPARAALAALLGDDLELSAVMQRVCDEMRAEEEAKQVVEAEGKG